MATAYKILGQSAPSSTTAVDLYTVPAGKSVVASTLSVCNITNSATTFSVNIRQNGALAGNANYVWYQVALAPNSTLPVTVGYTLAAGDVVTVSTTIGSSVAFSLFGGEIS